MLDRTKKKLASYFDNEPQMGTDGQLHTIDTVTRIDRNELKHLIYLHKATKPDVSVETGMAYGFSTISMLDAMEENGHGHHIAIDPRQNESWHGIGLTSIEQLGFSHRFTWIKARSDQAFVRMNADKTRVQFVFLDGIQYFDGIITDFFLANQILDIGGLIVFNQLWMPGGRAAASFISNNLAAYKPFATESEQFFAFRKVAVESRPWDHFVPFDGSGNGTSDNATRPNLFRKLFG